MSSIIIDIQGTELTNEDRELIAQPIVSGLIFFARNFKNKKQLAELIKEIRLVKKDIQLSVDQEGGRVQRFKEGFTVLPPLGELTSKTAENHANTMASELLEIGINVSFTPVLDLNRGLNTVIGNRSFGETPEQVIACAIEYIKGLRKAGMPSIGKHFPGHGGVALDSHTDLPIDERSFNEIEQSDLVPFKELAQQLDGIMTAHILFPNVDDTIATFSKKWIQDILRTNLGFTGTVYSDDMSMMGAKAFGDASVATAAAFDAGVNVALVCNDRAAQRLVIESVSGKVSCLDSTLQISSEHAAPQPSSEST